MAAVQADAHASAQARPTNKAASPVSPVVASGFSSPLGHALRRAKTVDDSLPARRRSVASRSEASPEAPPRRSSNFSDYSSEARDILNPKPQAQVPPPESSSLASISLAFALLPAISGSLFDNGHAVVTDILLLGLAGVFLHWSVTQPWVWYHAAQQVRIQHEADSDLGVEEDSDLDSSALGARPGSALGNVPEEEEEEEEEAAMPQGQGQTRGQQTASQQQDAALRELHRHEVLALIACLVLPLVSASLLHAIRAQLSRPSEGLVSNYNLTIFLLVSELRVFSHMLKLVQSRTLHLQRIVHGNPFASPSGTAAQMQDILHRTERLEARCRAEDAAVEQDGDAEAGRGKQEATVTRDVRNAIQPELDALNRAVRRYEKKATLLQLQTESRFAGLDARLEDAIALAAAAAKNSAASQGLVARTAQSLGAMVLFPLRAVAQLLSLPLRWLVALAKGNKQGSLASARPGRSRGAGKAAAAAAAQPRYGSDRVLTRVVKR